MDDEHKFDECYRVFIRNQKPKFFSQTNDEGDNGETMVFNLVGKNQSLSVEEKLFLKRYLVTPKFLNKSEALISNHSILKSLFANACSIRVIHSNTNELSTISQECLGTGIIVFKSVEKKIIMLYTCAHLFFPNESPNSTVREIIVSVSDGCDRKAYSAQIVSMGDFASKREDFNDWALLQIETDDFTEDLVGSETFIPSPNLSRELDFFEGDATPDIYTTLLIGYFTRGYSKMDYYETQRMRDLGINLEEVWKIIPEGMSLSFGWTLSNRDKTLTPIHNCGSTACCSGGPLLKCRIKIDELMQIGNLKPSKEKSEKLISLFEISFVSRTILGLHSSGIAKGNISCSSFNFFENYYEQVYSPHKNEFSYHDQVMIELEYEEFSKLKYFKSLQ